MRAVIQRVASASVSGETTTIERTWTSAKPSDVVDGEVISKISRGLMVLVGIESGPT